MNAKSPILFIIVAAFILLEGKISEAQTTTVIRLDSMHEDALVSDYYPNTNFGNNIEYYLSGWTVSGTPTKWRNLLKFDLSSIPSKAVVLNAHLSLFYPTINTNHSFHYDTSLTHSNISLVQRITSPWMENTVTWNTQPTFTTLNQVVIPQSTDTAQSYYLNVTDLVQPMVSDPSMNHGFLLQMIDESPYAQLLFASGDNPDTSQHPKVVVIYMMPPQSHFFSSDTIFCDEGGQCVKFYDQSTNNPSGWKWSFPGATPDSSTQKSPSNICYYTPGTYPVTLITTNIAGADTLVVSPMIKFSSGALPPALYLSHDTIFCSHAATYQWHFNGSPIAGATDSFYVARQLGDYSVYITDDFGCGRLSDGIIASVNEYMNLSGIKIYPNPSDGLVNIASDMYLKDVEVLIFNTLGKTVFSKQFHSEQQTLSFQMPKGIYFISINDGECIWNSKFAVR